MIETEQAVRPTIGAQNVDRGVRNIPEDLLELWAKKHPQAMGTILDSLSLDKRRIYELSRDGLGNEDISREIGAANASSVKVRLSKIRHYIQDQAASVSGYGVLRIPRSYEQHKVSNYVLEKIHEGKVRGALKLHGRYYINERIARETKKPVDRWIKGNKERAITVAEILLPDSQFQIFSRKVIGKSNEQIAGELGITSRYVRVQNYRAREKLAGRYDLSLNSEVVRQKRRDAMRLFRSAAANNKTSALELVSFWPQLLKTYSISAESLPQFISAAADVLIERSVSIRIKGLEDLHHLVNSIFFSLTEGKRKKEGFVLSVPSEDDLRRKSDVLETNLEEDVASKIVPEEPRTIHRIFRLPDVGNNLIRSATNGDIRALEQVFSRDLIEGIYRYFYFELYNSEPLNEKGSASNDTLTNPQDLAEAFSIRAQGDIVQALRGGDYHFDVSFNAWVFRKCRELAKQNKGVYKKRQVVDPLPYLSGDDRTILVLKDAVGLDLFQIAQTMRKPRPWVYRHWLAAEEAYSKSQDKTA